MRGLVSVLCAKAESLSGVIVPGMTHLQHGQPVRFGHVLAAHGWAFSRDLERVSAAQGRAMAVMPLGSAALAGTTLNLDLSALAQKLGFQSPPLNSYVFGGRSGLHRGRSFCLLPFSSTSESNF